MFVVGVGLVKVYSVLVTQWCDPMDCSLPGSSVHGILQARVLESESEVYQSCPTLCDPMDCSPPGSSNHRIF